MDCLFCKIIQGEIPAEILHQDDHTVAFLDVHPKAPGHTLVVPRTHAHTILDLPSESVGPLFLTVKRLTGILQSILSPDGFTIGINHGEKAGQSIAHLHVHILPRFEKDSGGNIHSVVNNPPSIPLEEVAQRVRNNNS